MKDEPERYKLTDEEFEYAFRLNAGLYTRTARWIKKHHGVELTRQAVYGRARNFKMPDGVDLITDTKEQNKDMAEEVLLDLLRSKDETIKLRAATLYLKAVAKDRGYYDRHEFTGNQENPIIIQTDARQRLLEAIKKLPRNGDTKGTHKLN